MRHTRIAVLTLTTLALTGRADTLELRAGGAVQGTYAGGTAGMVKLQTAQGVQEFPIADVSAIQFSAPPPPPPPTPPPAPAPAVAAGAVTLAAGTVLTVRMDTQVSSQDAGGKKFSGKLVADLSDGRTAAAKAGATVLGQVGQSKQAGRLAGKSELDISLVSLDVSGTLVPIMTTNFAETGKSSFRKTARNATAGAVIGNQVADDNGGGKGAAVGVGVSLIRKGDSVTVPPGAILEFRLTQPVTITPKP